MKHHAYRYLPYLNQQTLKVILLLLTLAAMAIAGGAPECAGGSHCGEG